MTDNRDSDWGPTASFETLQRRAVMLARARQFFAARGILEVETPMLGRETVTEPQIASMRCSASAAGNPEYFLQTSPEYFMKRLLAAGSPDIVQIGRVFRAGESGRYHALEFTMIEWYRRGLSLMDMIDETCALIATIGAGERPDFAAPRTIDYRGLFEAATGLNPLRAKTAELREQARKLIDPEPAPGLLAGLGDDRASCLDLLMSHVVIPGLRDQGLVAIHHYPAAQAALARLDPQDSRVAERFEIFHDGLELANGYRELRDAEQQRARFAGDRARRRRLGAPDVQADLKLLSALEHGLPDCCGVAVGFDRIVMRCLGLEQIDETVSFGANRYLARAT